MTSQALTFAIPDPIQRIWFYHKLQNQIKQLYGVTLLHTSKGLTCSGPAEKNSKALQDITKNYKSERVKGYQTDEVWDKLAPFHNCILKIDCDKLRGQHEVEMRDIGLEIEYFIVYKSQLQRQVQNLVKDLFGDLLTVSITAMVILLYSRIKEKLLEKYDCQLMIREEKEEFFLTLKGTQDSVSEARDRVEKIQKHKIVVLLSDRESVTHQSYFSSFKEVLRDRGYNLVYNKKLKSICESVDSVALERYYLEFVEKYGNFLGVVVDPKKEGKVRHELEVFLESMKPKEVEKSSRFEREKPEYFVGYSPNFSTPEHSSRKKTAMEEQNEVEFPITKSIYLGLHKFPNFIKKIQLIQTQYQIELFPCEIKRPQGDTYYCLKFLSFPQKQSMLGQLNFFFNEYKTKTIVGEINTTINLKQFERVVGQRLAEEAEFVDVVLDKFGVKNGCLQFEMYCGKQETKKIVQGLEKLIGREIKGQIKLVEKK